MHNTHETHGNNFGHWLRRIIHLAIIIIPIIYYWHGNNIANLFAITKEQCVSIIIFTIIIFEMCRLKFQWLFIGQRSYEKKQISAFAWTGFSIGLILLISPKIGVMNSAIAMPLIFSLAIVDPLLGELRGYQINNKINIAIGISITSIIWLLCSYGLDTPFWFFILIAPITVFAEQYKISMIDDNAMMLFLPLAFCFLLMPWV